MIISTFFSTYTPLLLVSVGALISEYAGVMAVFLEGILNLSAFLTLCFGIIFHSSTVALLLSALVCALFIFIVAHFTERTGANPFLTGLAVNLFVTGLISILSSIFFNTRGVIAFTDFIETIPNEFFFVKNISTSFGFFTVIIVLIALTWTKWGMRIKITGSDSDVLIRFGINPGKYRILSWVIPATMASIAGSLKAFKLGSFVPNISSGMGWIAIACVFLGHKKIRGVIIASIIFSLSELLSIKLQGASFGMTIPPTIFLSVPYIIPIIMLALMPEKIFQKRNLHKIEIKDNN
ncbi:MAG: ABC transporter permease [Treponema sp.]|nr:ABC transporter permease [Treponema sp.]